MRLVAFLLALLIAGPALAQAPVTLNNLTPRGTVQRTDLIPIQPASGPPLMQTTVGQLGAGYQDFGVLAPDTDISVNTAIALAAQDGGGYVYLSPSGTVLSAGIVDNYSNVTILCKNNGSTIVTGSPVVMCPVTTAPGAFAAGGTMLTVSALTGPTAQVLTGGGVSGLTFTGNCPAMSTTTLCTTDAADFISIRNFKIGGLYANGGFNGGAVFRFGVIPVNASGAGGAPTNFNGESDAQRNTISNITSNNAQNTSRCVQVDAWASDPAGQNQPDFSFSKFNDVTCSIGGGTGIFEVGSNNAFDDTVVYTNSEGSPFNTTDVFEHAVDFAIVNYSGFWVHAEEVFFDRYSGPGEVVSWGVEDAPLYDGGPDDTFTGTITTSDSVSSLTSSGDTGTKQRGDLVTGTGVPAMTTIQSGTGPWVVSSPFVSNLGSVGPVAMNSYVTCANPTTHVNTVEGCSFGNAMWNENFGNHAQPPINDGGGMIGWSGKGGILHVVSALPTYQTTLDQPTGDGQTTVPTTITASIAPAAGGGGILTLISGSAASGQTVTGSGVTSSPPTYIINNVGTSTTQFNVNNSQTVSSESMQVSGVSGGSGGANSGMLAFTSLPYSTCLQGGYIWYLQKSANHLSFPLGVIQSCQVAPQSTFTASWTSGASTISDTNTSALRLRQVMKDTSNPGAIPFGDYITAISTNTSFTLANPTLASSSGDTLVADPSIELASNSDGPIPQGATFEIGDATGSIESFQTLYVTEIYGMGAVIGGALNQFNDGNSSDNRLHSQTSATGTDYIGNPNSTVVLSPGTFKSGSSTAVTCSGSPTSSFVATNGIVTHC